MNLGADLADGVVLLDGVANGEAFRQVQRHWLLQVNVLAGFTGGDGDQRVPVGRGGDDDGVQVWLLQHLTEVSEALAGVFELLHHGVAAGLPGIARGGDNDVRLAGAGAEVGSAHAATANQADVDAAVRAGLGPGSGLRSGSEVRGGEADGGDGGGLFEEGAAGERVVLIHAGRL